MDLDFQFPAWGVQTRCWRNCVEKKTVRQASSPGRVVAAGWRLPASEVKGGCRVAPPLTSQLPVVAGGHGKQSLVMAT